MPISKVKLPDNSSQELHDYRISGVDSSPSSGSGNVVTSGGVYTSLAGKVSSSSVSTIVSLTQAQYNALTTKDANTAYIITDAQSGGTTEVFWATYGTTTFAEVDAAYQAGKLVCVDYGGATFHVGLHDDGTYYDFFYVEKGTTEVTVSGLYLENDDSWSFYPLQQLAPLTSPAFEGTPTAPTAATGTNTTQIATTAFVNSTINARKDVFIAEFGDTTFDAIDDALDEGKLVFCLYDSRLYCLTYLDDQTPAWCFSAVSSSWSADTVHYLRCPQFGTQEYDEYPSMYGWSHHTRILASRDYVTSSISGKEDTSNKVTSISSSSTHSQYPSAKAVYDMIGDVESALAALL